MKSKNPNRIKVMLAEKKKNNSKNSVKDVLKQIPEKDLRKFVAKELGIQEMLDDFMKEFKDYFLKGDTAEAYTSQIFSAFLDADEEYGYIPFSAQSKLLRVVSDAAEAAIKFREKGNYEAAIDICFTILENGIDAINHSDDSMGYLGSIMSEGIQGLHALADIGISKLDDYSRELFIEKCWECVEDNTFDGWDWHTDMYGFLISLAKEDYEYEDIIKSLDKDDYLKKDYHQDTLQKLKRELVAKWKGADAAHNFTMGNLQIKEFREAAIKEALEANDLSKAYQLTRDGIEQDKENKPGIVHTWNHWMLRIAQKENNRELIVKYASILYVDPFYEQGDFYEILKQTVPADKWSEFAEGLAKQAINSRHGEKYPDLCSREKWYDRLLEYIRKQGNIHTLQHYETQLLHDYRDEVITMYIDYAVHLKDSTYTSNRKTYQEMCRHLKHAVKLGGADKVQAAIDGLRKNYARSRALLEELNTIKL